MLLIYSKNLLDDLQEDVYSLFIYFDDKDERDASYERMINHVDHSNFHLAKTKDLSLIVTAQKVHQGRQH